MKPAKNTSPSSDPKPLAKDKRLHRDESELVLDEPEQEAVYKAKMEERARKQQEQADAETVIEPGSPAPSEDPASGTGDDGKDEFSSRARSAGASAPAIRKQEKAAAAAESMRKLDKIGRIVAIVVLPIVLGTVVITMFKSSGGSFESAMKRKPTLPMNGELLQVTEASSGWRARESDERVTTVQEVLTKKLVSPSRLPSVTLKVQSSKPLAFLRVLFFDETGRIAGDPRLVKVENGKVSPATPTSTAEKVIGANECRITASSGFINDSYLQDYFAGPARRWSVEISESADPRAKGSEWRELDTFAIKDLSL